jgi:HAD superfamily hydrolase (TIGR01549 family)
MLVRALHSRLEMKVKAVLFDLFGTLLMIPSDEVYYEPSLRKMHGFLKANGVKLSFKDFSRVYFEIRDSIYSETRKTLDEPHFNVRVMQTLQRLGCDFDVSNPIVTGATMAFADEFMRYVSVDDDALCVLKELKKKYKLGLISNFGIPECGHRLLKDFGLRELFDVIIISAEVNQRKPSPEIFKKALQDLNVDASEAVFIGDMLELDVKGPKSVGINTILIKREPTEAETGIKPDRVIKSLPELLMILKE